MTEIELLSYATLSQNEEDDINRILSELVIVPVHSPIARIAAELRRRYRLKIPDAAIAATALYTKTTLVTRNVHDFQNIDQLKVQAI